MTRFEEASQRLEEASQNFEEASQKLEEVSQRFEEVSQNTVFDVTREWRAVGKEPESHIVIFPSEEASKKPKTGRGWFFVVVENLSFVPCSHL